VEEKTNPSPFGERGYKNIRERPFNLHGRVMVGLWFFVSFRIIFFGQHERIFIFFVTQSVKFFPEFNISYLCPSFRPSKIFFVAFFSVTVNGRNLIFGHKLHIGTPYRGKYFWTHQIPTSCLPILLMLVTKYQISVINSCWEKCDEKCAYMFNVYKNQLSLQIGSRNLTDPKTLLTIWYTYYTDRTNKTTFIFFDL
jgi:hypothetical protein